MRLRTRTSCLTAYQTAAGASWSSTPNARIVADAVNSEFENRCTRGAMNVGFQGSKVHTIALTMTITAKVNTTLRDASYPNRRSVVPGVRAGVTSCSFWYPTMDAYGSRW